MFNALAAQAQKALRELSDAETGVLPTDTQSWSGSTCKLGFWTQDSIGYYPA